MKDGSMFRVMVLSITLNIEPSFFLQPWSWWFSWASLPGSTFCIGHMRVHDICVAMLRARHTVTLFLRINDTVIDAITFNVQDVLIYLRWQRGELLDSMPKSCWTPCQRGESLAHMAKRLVVGPHDWIIVHVDFRNCPRVWPCLVVRHAGRQLSLKKGVFSWKVVVDIVFRALVPLPRVAESLIKPQQGVLREGPVGCGRCGREPLCVPRVTQSSSKSMPIDSIESGSYPYTPPPYHTLRLGLDDTHTLRLDSHRRVWVSSRTGRYPYTAPTVQACDTKVTD